MSSTNTGGESPIFQAVKDLGRSEIEERVRRNASALGIDVSDDHLKVIEALVEHYRAECQQQDCRSASPHMRFLIDSFEDRGGSKYLYRLFDQASTGEETKELGVLTLIHRLADLPELTYNEDEGFGTVI